MTKKHQPLTTKLFLRVTLKILSAIGVLSLMYIFIVGLFGSGEPASNQQYTFNLALLQNNSATYFNVKNRKLLVIKNQASYSIFWANDPIYGCLLEYVNSIIKPVCIDLEYDLTGYNKKAQQMLTAPEYKITLKNKLIVY